MKLATVRSKDNLANGQLVVVSRDLKKAEAASGAWGSTLLEALQTWATTRPLLETIYTKLNEGAYDDAINFNLDECMAPLPNAPGFYDGSAFLSHVVRARKARGDEMPASAKVTPLMYQGVSDHQLAFNAPIELIDEKFGGDFEGEFAVITTEVPRGTRADQMEPYVALLTMFNDITYREIVKTEIETKFGFLQSKPNSAYAPIVVTLDEVALAWKNGRLGLDMQAFLNDKLFGSPNGSEMHFSFYELVAHACRTRPLSAGNIVGCGTISNEDKNKGFACLTEKRFQEILDEGKASTPWLKPGDHVRLETFYERTTLFGPINQKVTL